VPYGAVQIAVPPPVGQAPVMLKTPVATGLAAGGEIPEPKVYEKDIGKKYAEPILTQKPVKGDISAPVLGEEPPPLQHAVNSAEFWALVKQMTDGGISEAQAYSMAVQYYQYNNPGTSVPGPDEREQRVAADEERLAYGRKIEADRWIESTIQTLMREQNIPREWAAYELYQQLKKPGNPYEQYLQWTGWGQQGGAGANQYYVPEPGAPQAVTTQGPVGLTHAGGTETRQYQTQEQRQAATTSSFEAEQRWNQTNQRRQALEQQYFTENPIVQPSSPSNMPTWSDAETRNLFAKVRKIQSPASPGRLPQYRYDKTDPAYQVALRRLQQNYQANQKAWVQSKLQLPPNVPPRTGGFPA